MLYARYLNSLGMIRYTKYMFPYWLEPFYYIVYIRPVSFKHKNNDRSINKSRYHVRIGPLEMGYRNTASPYLQLHRCALRIKV